MHHALSKLKDSVGIFSEALASKVILAFSDDQRVRLLAISELGNEEGDRAAIAVAFGGDTEIRSLIVAGLSPLTTRLRNNIVHALGERPIQDTFATDVLRLYRQEDDPEVKTSASIAYHRRLAESGADTTAAVARLGQGIVAFGVEQTARRQAALCGLLELDRIDVFQDAVEHASTIRKAVVPFEDFTSNFATLHCVGEALDEAP